MTSTSPSSRGQGASHQPITITGTGFVSGATADFGAGITVHSATYSSPTSLSADISVAGGAALGSRTVTVTNPDGGVGSCAGCFTVTPAELVSIAVTPASSSLANGLDSQFTATGTYWSSPGLVDTFRLGE